MGRRTRRHATGLAFVALLTSVTLGASPAAEKTARADDLAPVAVIIRGRGFGHGRGLSQYGALGWATKLNATWRDILTFYYGGSGRAIANLSDLDPTASSTGRMTVRLEALDGKNTSIVSDNDTANWSGATGMYGALVAQPVGTNLYDVWGSAGNGCVASGTPSTSSFTLIGDNVKGPVEFSTLNGGNVQATVPADILGVCEPPSASYAKGRIRYYRGTVRAVTDKNGNRRTVNTVATEFYVRGVVPRESPASWGDAGQGRGMHALRAQAVAARSYGLSEKRYSYAKTCDTMSCQVYGGAALRNVGSSTAVVLEDKRTNAAVSDTAGIVIKDSNNTVVRTEFTSSNGGRTAGGQFPAKLDAGDVAADAALQAWSRTASAAAVQKKYPSIGVFTSIDTAHDGLGGDWDGYATSVTITGTSGSVTRTAWEFRSDFDLPAPWYETFLVHPAEPNAPPVGQVLFVGDSVAESITSEFAHVVTPAYPSMNFQACAGRGMVGQTCMFTVSAPQIDTDGLGIVNAAPTPAVAVVALGYNDDPSTFESELQQVISVLTTRGVPRILLVNLSTRSTSRAYARSNAAMTAAATANPAVTVLDWNTASSPAENGRWFDNTSLCCWVHLSLTGQTEFALFLREQLDALRTQGLLPTDGTAAAVLPGLPLSRKTEGAMVSTVQSRLNKLLKLRGTARLTADGRYGTLTWKTVRRFQRSKQLPVTGTVDRTTWEAMWSGPRGDLAVLRVGTRHPAVSTVQRALAKVLGVGIATTGYFDESLAARVRTFQQRAKLKVNGRVGPTTWTVLMDAAARA